MKYILEVDDLKKSYGSVKAVKGVSFQVKPKEIFGIIGPNGAGKTTTLEMIETLTEIDSGQATVAGVNVASEPEKVRSIIGVQPQSPAFQDKTKLHEIIDLFAAAHGESVDSIAALESVQLAEKADAYVENLSGGQRQRLSIAAALVHKPEILFLDEPTTGLDPQARRNLWELVKSIREQDVTVVITTHYMDEAEILCDRIAIMDNGKIIALDSPKALIKNLIKSGFKKNQHVEQANLEDVFIDLTGKELRE